MSGKRKWSPNYGNNLGPNTKRSRPSVPGAPVKAMRPVIQVQMQPQVQRRNNKPAPGAPRTHKHMRRYNQRTVGNTRRRLENKLNLANYERIIRQFRRGNINNPRNNNLSAEALGATEVEHDNLDAPNDPMNGSTMPMMRQTYIGGRRRSTKRRATHKRRSTRRRH